MRQQFAAYICGILAVLALGCSKKSTSGSGSPDAAQEPGDQPTDNPDGTGGDQTPDPDTSGQPESCTAADGSALPEGPQVNLTTGAVAITIPDDIDPGTVKIQVVGQPALTTQQASDCSFFVEGISEGNQDLIVTAGTVAVSTLRLTQDIDRAVVVDGVAVTKNAVVKGGKVDVPLAGSIKGKVKKHGQSNHLGIDVYIPGVTGFMVKTDTDGAFTLKLPVGTSRVAFESDGYNTLIRKFAVTSAKESDIGEIQLSVDTLGTNAVEINNGDAASDSLTVTVQVGAPAGAIRMRISESNDFSGKSWQVFTPVFQHTFAAFPADVGVTASQICVSIENEDGSEVSNCDSIYLDPFAVAGNVFMPSFSLASSSITARDGKFSLTGISVPAGSTQMTVAYGDRIKTISPATSYDFALENAADCGSGNIRLWFTNGNNHESAVKTSVNTEVSCWAATSATSAPSVRHHEGDIPLNLIPTGDNPDTDFAHKLLVFGGQASGMQDRTDGAFFDPRLNSWTPIASYPAPAHKYSSLVWTGATGDADTRNRIIIWGGKENGTYVQAGHLYDAESESWTATGSGGDGAPSIRAEHLAVWSGNRMLVWGGTTDRMDAAQYRNDGGLYDPKTGAWTTLETTNAPSARAGSGAVSAGATVYIYGGYFNQANGASIDVTYNELYKFEYDNTTDANGTWTQIDTSALDTLQTGGVPTKLYSPLMIYTGAAGHASWKDRILILSGMNVSNTPENAYLIYNIASDSWSQLSKSGAPSFVNTTNALEFAFADGRLYMLRSAGSPREGAYYDFETQTWERFAVNDLNAAVEPDYQTSYLDPDRVRHRMAIVDGHMVIWAGLDGSESNDLNSGAIYYPFPRP